MIDELTIFRMSALVFAVAGIGLLGWTFRYPRNQRRYGFVMAFAVLAMGAAHYLMSIEFLTLESPDGYPILNVRFAGYAVAWGAVVLLMSRITNVKRRYVALLFAGIYGILGCVLAGWYLTEPESQFTALGGLVSLILAIVVLLKPYSTAATEVSGERRLLFGKLRNFSVLVWVGLTIIGLLSRQNLALLDTFVGVTLGAYMDLLYQIGVAIILMRSRTAIEDMSGTRGSADGQDTDRSTPTETIETAD